MDRDCACKWPSKYQNTIFKNGSAIIHPKNKRVSFRTIPPDYRVNRTIILRNNLLYISSSCKLVPLSSIQAEVDYLYLNIYINNLKSSYVKNDSCSVTSILSETFHNANQNCGNYFR